MRSSVLSFPSASRTARALGRRRPSKTPDTLESLTDRMGRASTYAEWQALAERHDVLSGAAEWRKTAASSLYDFKEIQGRHTKLQQLLSHGSAHELLYALNEGVHGNMGGMGQAVLYGRAMCGTKHLIEGYVAAIAEALERVAHASDAEIPHAEKLDLLRRASHCYGRSALLLSGGAGLIYFHHGVVQALIEQNLVPNVISGSSAGSVIAAMLGSQTDDELRDGFFIRKRYHEADRTSMMDAILGRIAPDQHEIIRERALDEIIPQDLTFQEAYEHTGRYINISVSPAGKHQSSRLLNAITAPNVYVRAAVAASTSIPGVSPPIRLYAKGFDGKPRPYLESRRWVDGSFSHDLPVRRLSRIYGVNHFIVSMVNPIVLPFVEDVTVRRSEGIRSAATAGSVRVLNELLTVGERMLARGGKVGGQLSQRLAYLIALLEQNYLGDINILIQQEDFRWLNAIFQFEEGDIEHMIEAGMRRTWPKIARIRNAALISRTLDRLLEQLNDASMPKSERGKHRQYV